MAQLSELYARLAEVRFKGSPRETIEQYCDAFMRTDVAGQLIAAKVSNNFTISIASSESSLGINTRRATLVASTAFLSHPRSERGVQLHIGRYVRPEEDWERAHFLRCDDLQVLGKWLQDCGPLIQSKRMIYIPRLEYTDTHNYSSARMDPAEEGSVAELIGQGWLAACGGSNQGFWQVSSHGDRLFKPLVRVDLPVIENVTMRDYSSIAASEPDALESTRDYLRKKLIELDSVADVEDLERGIGLLEVELAEGLREARAEMKRLTSRHAVQATGAALATGGATLVAIAGTALASAVAIVGASGGAIGLVAAVNEYLADRSKSRIRPFYFFWLLDRTSRRI